jgi:hypothetical protein
MGLRVREPSSGPSELGRVVIVVWIILTGLFLAGLIREWIVARRGLQYEGFDIEPMNLGFIDLNEDRESLRQGILEIERRLKDLVIDADKQSHRGAAFSYLLGPLAAVASLFIEVMT